MAPKKDYTPQQMGDAIEAVRKGEKIATAAQRFGVPRITLYNKISGKSPVVCSMGPQTILSKSEEEILEKWLLAMSNRHFPINRDLLMESVQKIVVEQGKPNPFTNNRPGKKWFQSFLKRHPEITEKTAQNLTKSRDDVTEEDLRRWFSEIQLYLEEKGLKDILEEPNRVFNTDESAFFLSPKAGRVLCKRGDKHLYNFCGDEKDNLTVLITANAAGQLAPPMIVFKYERVPSNITSTVPGHWGIGKSESGWMCGSTFYEFMANIFNPWLEEQGIQKPIVFFLDGHKSHLTLHLSKFCSENGIEVIALYPNSTHLLQPMDLAVFRPLKVAWRKEVTRWQLDHLGETLKKQHFAPVLENAISSISEDCIRNGFRAGGLYPFGPDYIDMSKLNKTKNKTGENIDPKQIEFHKYLESEIVNVYSKEKLALFNKLYYKDRTALENIVPNEDEALYVIWAKNKQTVSSKNASAQTASSTDGYKDVTKESDNDQPTSSNNAKIATDVGQEEQRTDQSIPTVLSEMSVSDQLAVDYLLARQLASETSSLCSTIQETSGTERCASVLTTSSTEGYEDVTKQSDNDQTTSSKNAKIATDVGQEEHRRDQSISTVLSEMSVSDQLEVDSLLAYQLASETSPSCSTIQETSGTERRKYITKQLDNNGTTCLNKVNAATDAIPEKKCTEKIIPIAVHSEIPMSDQPEVFENPPSHRQTSVIDGFENITERINSEQSTSSNNENLSIDVGRKDTNTQEVIDTEMPDHAAEVYKHLHENQPVSETSPCCSTAQTQTPQKLSLEATLGITIPSPFKRSLFWPEEIKDQKRKKKEKIPYAVTSKAWQEYHQKKEIDKLKLEEEKEKRAKERHEKKILKERNMQIKKKQTLKRKKTSGTIHSDSDTDDEPLSELIKSTKSVPTVGQFVIVKYEGEYFPGKTEKVDENQYEISTMVLSTGNSFRWPDKPDKIWYRADDLVEVISDPLPLNKRGFFKIKEMQKYLPNLYDI